MCVCVCVCMVPVMSFYGNSADSCHIKYIVARILNLPQQHMPTIWSFKFQWRFNHNTGIIFMQNPLEQH